MTVHRCDGRHVDSPSSLTSIPWECMSKWATLGMYGIASGA